MKRNDMKVAIFSHHVEIGGGETSLFYLAKSLGEIIPIKVVLNKRGPLLDLLEMHGISPRILRFYFTKRPLSLMRPTRVSRILKTTRFLKKEKIDIIHPNTFHDYLSLLPASKLSGVPILPFIRGSWERPDLKALSNAQQKGEPIVTVSQSLKEEIKKFGIEAITIKMGVIPELFEIENLNKKEKKRELGLNMDKKTICLFSRISPEKDIEKMVKAANNLLRHNFRNFEVLIVGSEVFSRDRDYKSFLISEIKKRGMEKFFHFLGFRFDIPEILAICDVVVLTSPRETVGRTIQESMAAGRPLVVSKTIELAKFLKDGEDALLFDPKGKDNLSEKIKLLLEDKALSQRIALNAKKRKELYDQKYYDREIVTVYKKLIALKK